MKENYTNFFSLLADFEKEANRLIKEDKNIWEPDRTIGWSLEESVDTLMEHVADVSDFDWDTEPDGEGGEIPTNAPIVAAETLIITVVFMERLSSFKAFISILIFRHIYLFNLSNIYLFNYSYIKI